MPIVQATRSFVHREGGSVTEVHEGDQRSAYDPVVLANEKLFKTLSAQDVKKATEQARPQH